MAELKLLDTQAFNDFIDNKDTFLTEYTKIQSDYNKIVEDLVKIWKGRGATAFYEDAMTIKSNISGIADILQTMCDMLTDCKNVFDECDAALNKVNKEAADTNE